jgi:lipid II isoglutaminyl synthase (glutamine-hydrolysing)
LCYDAGVNIRLFAALAAGKTLQAILRRLKLGGGTALPGRVAEVIDPSVLAVLVSSLAQGSVIVTGTNGKTTSSRLISDMLRRAGHTPIHNRSGSNMVRGLISTVVAGASMKGVLPGDVGVWEVDEATLPDVLKSIRPRVVLFNNLFRDQLDRYGEVNTVGRIWERALSTLPLDCIVVLNADDPRVANLGESFRGKVVYFGVEDDRRALETLPEAADSIHCLRCARPLVYDAVFSSHMGRYHCASCGLTRPLPDIQARTIDITDESSDVDMVTPAGAIALHLPLPGLYNAYNALAATAVAVSLGVGSACIQAAAAEFHAAFGRVERLKVGEGKEIALFLVKNPAGFNEVLRTVFTGSAQRDVLIMINDLLADGTDVSWLWDVDFEVMQGRVARATVAGIRAKDMALRLRYANVVPIEGDISVEPAIARSIVGSLEAMPAGGTLYVLPTYTAMLEAKENLARRGLAPRWQDD